MSNENYDPDSWLNNEDAVCYEGRLKRLKWLDQNLPEIEYVLLSGGITTKYLFDGNSLAV